MSSGDLAQAVRASIAVPLLFAPELRDGRFLADGGLSANMPVAVARAAGAERVIVSDATEHLPPDSVDGYSPLLVADRLVQFLFQQPPTRCTEPTSSSGRTWRASPASTSPTGTSSD